MYCCYYQSPQNNQNQLVDIQKDNTTMTFLIKLKRKKIELMKE